VFYLLSWFVVFSLLALWSLGHGSSSFFEVFQVTQLRLFHPPSRKVPDCHASYAPNSPEAAARIVALVLIADGHVCRSEFDVLNQLDAPRLLGLEPDQMPRVVQALCEDLLMAAYAADR
jgi:hypothetical protein